MNISKIMTSIFGGMITTDEAELAIRLRASRDAYIRPPGLRKAVLRRLYLPAAAFAFSAPGYRLVELLRGWGLMAGLEDYYKPDRIEMPADYQTGLTAIEARIGTSQSQRLHRFIAARRAWAQHYREVFADHPLLTFFDVDAGASYSHIAVKTTHKAAVLATARRYGVELGEIIDYVVPSMAAYASKAPGSWPVATKLAGSVVNLPVSNRFDRVRAQQITARLQKALAEIDL
jgi:dTDP-4-amino-4,6-dideoxygalactose transaminase